MLEQVQAAAGDQDPSHLVQRPAGIGDGAEGERAQRGLARGVGERHRLPIEANVDDRDPRGADARLGDLACGGSRLDRQHLGHRLGVVGHVEP